MEGSHGKDTTVKFALFKHACYLAVKEVLNIVKLHHFHSPSILLAHQAQKLPIPPVFLHEI